MKAIDGLVMMSPDLEEVYNKVFDNQVPEIWKNVQILKLLKSLI